MSKRYLMHIVTSEIVLDGLLSRICNNIEDAQKPEKSACFEIRSGHIPKNSLMLEAKWGGCLYLNELEK